MQKTDSKEDIQMCLHCPRPECINCLGGEMYARGSAKHEIWRGRIREMAAAGLTDRQMGKRLGINEATVARYRKAMGIPPLSPGKKGGQVRERV